jgi:glycosyltransferase involved in cell wall biosynthesis
LTSPTLPARGGRADGGNGVTIGRIAAIVREETGLETIARTPDAIPNVAEDMNRYLAAADVGALFALHAFKCGDVLDRAAELRAAPGGGVPTVLVLGGTDVNVDVGAGEDKVATLARRAAAADRVVAFSESMVRAAKPGTLPPEKTIVVPQGVVLPDDDEDEEEAEEEETEAEVEDDDKDEERADGDERFERVREDESTERAAATVRVPAPTLREALGAPPETPVFLLPAGLRPVKDVLWAVDAAEREAARIASRTSDDAMMTTSPATVSSATTSAATTISSAAAAAAASVPSPPFLVAVVGPSLDAAYAAEVSRRFERSTVARLLPGVTRARMVAYMRQATAVLNTSESEGQSGALLEAAAAGTPILARDIPGNRALLDLLRDAAQTESEAEAEAEAEVSGRTTIAAEAETNSNPSDENSPRHACGTLRATPEAFAAALASFATNGSSAMESAARARDGANALARTERRRWRRIVSELAGETRDGASASTSSAA